MNLSQSPASTFKNQMFPKAHTLYPETKLCIIVDSKTPVIKKVSIAPECITLRHFKTIASLHNENYKFYFKSHDTEFGLVKEEVIDDDSLLPVDGDRIVAWVLSNKTNTLSLFEPDCSQDRLEEASTTYATGSTQALNFNAPRILPRPNQPIYSSTGGNSQESTYISVQLKLDNYNFLGLTLVGPSDELGSTDRGIYVGEIADNSVVQQDGRIEVGDRIVEINDLHVRDMKSDDAVALFRRFVDRRGAINLVLERSLRYDWHNRGRFTLPREYANVINYQVSQKSLDPCNQHGQELPIPIFDSDSRSTPKRPDPKIIRATHSLPRSITPKSLYATNNFENIVTNSESRFRTDSRSVYEPSTPTCLRQLDVALHCEKNQMETIYSALRNDAKSLDIKDREWLKVTIHDAFLGSSLVKWLSNNVYGFSHRREVKRYANKMLSKGLIKNPVASGTFSEKCYYTLNGGS